MCMQEGTCRARDSCENTWDAPGAMSALGARAAAAAVESLLALGPSAAGRPAGNSTALAGLSATAGSRLLSKARGAWCKGKVLKRMHAGDAKPCPHQGSACFLCSNAQCYPADSCILRMMVKGVRWGTSPQLKLGLSQWCRLPLSPGQQWAQSPRRYHLGYPAARQDRPVLAR